MRVIFSILLFSVLTQTVSTARADLIISFKDTELSPRGVGSVDVLLRSSSDIALFGFSAKFEISTETSGGVLEFQPTDQQLDSERNFAGPDYSYIFLNKNGAGFGADRQADKLQLVSGDFATEDVTLLANTDYLLARLEVNHNAPIGVSHGVFRIRLVDDPATNLFADFRGNSHDLNAASFSNFGTLSITAVPEPSCLILSGCATLSLLLVRRGRRTMASRPDSSSFSLLDVPE